MSTAENADGSAPKDRSSQGGATSRNGGSDDRASDQEIPGLYRPASKAARLNAIEEILLNNVIGSQAQLSTLLEGLGFDVTQATLSRDLDEIKAVKTKLGDGSIAYRLMGDVQKDLPADLSSQKVEQQVSKALTGLIFSVAASRNLVVIHTSSGAAQYVASIIDRQPLDDILGTIAGDDTVLMICTTDQTASQRTQWLLEAVSKER